MEMEQTVCQQSSPSSLLGPSLSAVAVVSCCLLLLLISSRRSSNNKKKKPPPGRGSSLLWSVLETMSFLADNSSGRGFYHFVEARHRRYGPPCFRTSLFGRTHVFVSSPDAARALLAAADSAAFSKRYVRTVADLLGEHSLLCASHERHRSLRRALAPLFFNAQTTASLAASFDALTVQAISGWSFSPSSSSVVVVLDAALGITFEAICGMLVGTLLRHDNKERMQSDVLAVTQAMLAFPLRMPGTRFHAGLQVVVAYNSYSSHIYIYI
jgi:cytochrome P450